MQRKKLGVALLSAFGEDAEDDEAIAKPSSRTFGVGKKTQEPVEEYDFDGDYDAIKEAMQSTTARKTAQSGSSALAPRYIQGALEAASQRKRDRLLAEEKMMSKEREKEAIENPELAAKEKFVTESYRRQLEEARASAKSEASSKSEVRSMTNFHKNVLQDREAVHEAAMKASEKARLQGPSFVVEKPQVNREEQEKQAAIQKGLHFTLNDDNQLVDKRQLLVRGLNISKKPPTPAPQVQRQAEAVRPEKRARLEEPKETLQTTESKPPPQTDVAAARARFLARKAARDSG